VGASIRRDKFFIGSLLFLLAARTGPPSMDLLPIDVTDLPDPTAARFGNVVTLIGQEISIDDLAAAIKSTVREVLRHLGHRFRRIYYAI
jgi:alanine racemase